jgi:hypothetical protein
VRLRRRILAEANGLCAYCRSAERLMGVLFEVDHIVPVSANGETVLENLCFACPTCNRFKPNSLFSRDPDTGQAAHLFHPRRDRWVEHFFWSDDSTIILGLTPGGRATTHLLRMNRADMVELRRYWVMLHLHPPA